MRTFARFALTICLVFSVLGNAFAATSMTSKDWEEFMRGSYQVGVGAYGPVFTGHENKTVIGDIFTGAGMGALMLVKTPVNILVNIGFRLLRDFDISNELIECEKRIREQYSASYQMKRYEREHPY